MFADSTLETSWAEHTRRSWTTLTSFALQATVTAILLLIPLIRPIALPFLKPLATPVMLAPPPAPPPSEQAYAIALGPRGDLVTTARGITAELRPYQRDGVAWLQHLRAHDAGGVLADDMGLGKTLQTIAHIMIEKEQGRLDRPAMVVTLTSVVGNWMREAERFTPDLRVAVHQLAVRHALSRSFAGDEARVLLEYGNVSVGLLRTNWPSSTPQSACRSQTAARSSPPRRTCIARR